MYVAPYVPMTKEEAKKADETIAKYGGIFVMMSFVGFILLGLLLAYGAIRTYA